MLKLSVNELSTYRWSFEEDVFSYSHHGFDAIGVWRSKLAEFGSEKASMLLQDQGLQVSSLGWAGGFTGGDGRSASLAIHDAFDAIDAAAQLNADCLVLVTGGRNNHTPRHMRRLLKQALSEVCEAAAAMRVELAIEPMHMGSGTKGCVLHSIQNTVDLISDVGWPGLGMVFDSYHLSHDRHWEKWLPEVAPLIRLVQLADACHAPMGEQDRCPLGQGRLPLRQIIERLEDVGYDGFVELEVFGESVERLDYDQLLSHSYQAMGSLIRTPADA